MGNNGGIAVVAIANDMANGVGAVAGVAMNSVLGDAGIAITKIPEKGSRRISQSRARVSEEKLTIGATRDKGDIVVEGAGSEKAEHQNA